MSIIKRGRVLGSGNSVADYSWAVEKCDTCEGSGEIYADFDEIKDFVINACLDMKGNIRKDAAKIGISLWHKVKKDFMIPCPDCEGRGKWESWH